MAPRYARTGPPDTFGESSHHSRTQSLGYLNTAIDNYRDLSFLRRVRIIEPPFPSISVMQRQLELMQMARQMMNAGVGIGADGNGGAGMNSQMQGMGGMGGGGGGMNPTAAGMNSNVLLQQQHQQRLAQQQQQQQHQQAQHSPVGGPGGPGPDGGLFPGITSSTRSPSESPMTPRIGGPQQIPQGPQGRQAQELQSVTMMNRAAASQGNVPAVDGGSVGDGGSAGGRMGAPSPVGSHEGGGGSAGPGSGFINPQMTGGSDGGMGSEWPQQGDGEYNPSPPESAHSRNPRFLSDVAAASSPSSGGGWQGGRGFVGVNNAGTPGGSAGGSVGPQQLSKSHHSSPADVTEQMDDFINWV